MSRIQSETEQHQSNSDQYVSPVSRRNSRIRAGGVTELTSSRRVLDDPLLDEFPDKL